MSRATLLAVALAGALVGAAPAPAAPVTTLRAHLSGRSDVPRGAPHGRGSAKITVIPGGRICWRLSLHGTDKPIRARIHKGIPGTFGPVIVTLGGGYHARGCRSTSAAVLEQIAEHPSAFYVEIHTRHYPTGAARGQLAAA